MAMFQYQALNRSGQTVRGQIEAENQQLATTILAEQGLFVDEITTSAGASHESIRSYKKRPYKLRLAEKDRVEFIRQLATALQAQLPLMSALQVVGQQNPRPAVKQLVAELSENIKSGESLSYAMGCYPRIFDRLAVSMVAVGETTGSLDQSMTQLADLSETALEARNEITTASLYPLFVLVLGLISVGIIVTFILPRILGTLAAGLETQPWPTRVLFAISEFFKSPAGWIFICFVLLAGVIFNRWKRTSRGRFIWDGIKLRTPILGPVQQKLAVARLARTLGTLTNGGVTIVEALQIVRNTLGNEDLAREVDKLTRQVRTGSSLAVALRQSGRFPPLLVQIVTVGEQTGEFAELLLGAAEAFDRDSRVAIKRFMAIFPAILLLILALIIGFIVAATLLPIVQIETGISGT